MPKVSFKPLFSEENTCIWVFDRYDFKEAVTLLLLNDTMEKDENDLELKKLISTQFPKDVDMTLWAMELFNKVCHSFWLLFNDIYAIFSCRNFQESNNLSKRLPKKPIYVHIETEDSNKHMLTGKYNFHSIRKNVPVFVRDGEKILTFDPYPYYLAYSDSAWYFQDSEFFNDGNGGGWMRLQTKGF